MCNKQANSYTNVKLKMKISINIGQWKTADKNWASEEEELRAEVKKKKKKKRKEEEQEEKEMKKTMECCSEKHAA